VHEVAIDRAGQRAAVSGHRGHHKQPHPLQSLAHLRGGEPALLGDDPAQMRARANRAVIQQLLEAVQVR
jgi:hypothetical protein